jgi:hypothetical protein
VKPPERIDEAFGAVGEGDAFDDALEGGFRKAFEERDSAAEGGLEGDVDGGGG